MNKQALIKTIEKSAPYILAGTSTAAIIGSNLMSAKAGIRIADKARRLQYEFMEPKEKAEFIFKQAIPRAIMPASVAGSAILMTWALLILEERKLAAAAGILAGTETILKAREKSGKGKDYLDILAEEAEKEIEIFDTGTGDTMFFEPYSQTFFLASEQFVLECEMGVNRTMNLKNYVNLSRFLELLGLRTTNYTDGIGWSVFSEQAYNYKWIDFSHHNRKIQGKDYISIDYPFAPHWDYLEPHFPQIEAF